MRSKPYGNAAENRPADVDIVGASFITHFSGVVEVIYRREREPFVFNLPACPCPGPPHISIRSIPYQVAHMLYIVDEAITSSLVSFFLPVCVIFFFFFFLRGFEYNEILTRKKLGKIGFSHTVA